MGLIRRAISIGALLSLSMNVMFLYHNDTCFFGDCSSRQHSSFEEFKNQAIQNKSVEAPAYHSEGNHEDEAGQIGSGPDRSGEDTTGHESVVVGEEAIQSPLGQSLVQPQEKQLADPIQSYPVPPNPIQSKNEFNLVQPGGPTQLNPALPDPPQSNPVLPDPAQSNAVMPDPAQLNVVLPDPAQLNAVLPDLAQASPVLPDPAQSNPVLPDPIQSNPVLPDPAQSNPVLPDPAKSNPLPPAPASPAQSVPDPPPNPAESHPRVSNSEKVWPPLRETLKKIRAKLDEDLIAQIEHYLAGDPCTRWNTPEDGDDLVRMFLRIRWATADQNVKSYSHLQSIVQTELPPWTRGVNHFPFVTKFTLAELGDFAYFGKKQVQSRDKSRGSVPDRLGDVIWIQQDAHISYALDLQPLLTQKVIVVSHENNRPRGTHTENVQRSDKTHIWFSRDPWDAYPNVIPIPIGVTEYMAEHFHKYKDIRDEMLYPDFFDANTNPKPANRSIFILANFNADHGRYRKAALEVFSNISSVQLLNSDTRFDRFGQYLKLLTQCQFVLSPPGFDQDCYRTYECLLLGSIPIVYSFAGINPLFKITPTLMYPNWVRPARAEEINSFVPPTKSRKVVIWHYWRDQILCAKRRLIDEKTV